VEFDRVVLIVHVAAGFAGLAAGAAALAAVKGGRLHRRAGAAFFWAMVTVAGSAFVLAVLRPSRFLFLVAAFTLYVVFAGRRAAVAGVAGAGPVDRAAAVGMLATGLVMIGWGALDLLGRWGATSGTVLMVFGALGGLLAAQDLATLARGSEGEPERIRRHLGRMVGGLIAAVTAFAVVNAGFLPELARWLLPTALGVPVILYWSRRVRRAGTAPGRG
jgi:uncharacterized membrane protein